MLDKHLIVFEQLPATVFFTSCESFSVLGIMNLHEINYKILPIKYDRKQYLEYVKGYFH